MKRREFIQASLAAASVSLIPSWAFSQEAEPQFFLQFYMDSGWDTTLMTEAWNFQKVPDPQKIFIEYSENETVAFGSAFLGPTMVPLKKYFSRMTVFNGVMMSPVEVGHPSPAAFSVSGVSDGSEPNFVCQFLDLFYKNQSRSIIANTSVATAGRSYKIATTKNISNLAGFSGGAMNMDANQGLLIESAYGSLSKVSEKLNQVTKQHKAELDKIQDKDVKVLMQGFLSQLYPSAFIRLGGNLDTHSGHVGVHKNSLIDNFQTIASYLDGLSSIQWKNSGKSLLDLTTVVISSDFTRTPALNVGGGKDHNPFSNSMIVFSPKIKSEIIVGRSRLLEAQYSPIGVSTILAMPVDINTLNPIVAEKETTMLTPSVIYGSIIDAHGLNAVASSDVLKKSFKLKTLYK